jgi:hypothetical protein
VTHPAAHAAGAFVMSPPWGFFVLGMGSGGYAWLHHRPLYFTASRLWNFYFYTPSPANAGTGPFAGVELIWNDLCQRDFLYFFHYFFAVLL